MRAGKLRHTVIIQISTPTQSASGAVTESWATHATVHARVSPSGGYEKWQGDIPDGGRMHDIEIRYLSTVTIEMRVKFGTRIFNIKELINPHERNINMILKCEESLD